MLISPNNTSTKVNVRVKDVENIYKKIPFTGQSPNGWDFLFDFDYLDVLSNHRMVLRMAFDILVNLRHTGVNNRTRTVNYDKRRGLGDTQASCELHVLVGGNNIVLDVRPIKNQFDCFAVRAMVGSEQVEPVVKTTS